MKRIYTLNKLSQFALVSFMALSFSYQAQDIHFSQFQENPSLLNPALTGVSSMLRVSGVYRDQWRGVSVPYKTYGLSVESRLKSSNWNEVEGQSMTFSKAKMNRFAGGLSFYSDKAGDGNMSTTNVNLSLSTFVPLNDLSKLSVGLQGSFVQRKIDFTKLIFSNQYNGSGYDASLASGENAAAQTFMYPDLAAGVNWNYATQDKMIASNKQKKANLGIAVQHITRPNKLT